MVQGELHVMGIDGTVQVEIQSWVLSKLYEQNNCIMAQQLRH